MAEDEVKESPSDGADDAGCAGEAGPADEATHDVPSDSTVPEPLLSKDMVTLLSSAFLEQLLPTVKALKSHLSEVT